MLKYQNLNKHKIWLIVFGMTLKIECTLFQNKYFKC